MDAFELTHCTVHGRFLSLGEMERAACSWCEPGRFRNRCTSCGQRVPAGGACSNHTMKRKGGNG